MASLNNVTYSGYIVTDPILKTFGKLEMVTLMIESTDYKGNAMNIPVTAWDETAREAANNLKKGDHVVISGRLSSRKSKAGEGVFINVYASHIYKAEDTNGRSSKNETKAAQPVDDNIIPF